MRKKIQIPDLGGITSAKVIEVLVKPGDVVSAEDIVLIIEGDKAAIEVPAQFAGTIVEVLSVVGDQVSSSTEYLSLDITPEFTKSNDVTDSEQVMVIKVPDLGVAGKTKVIDILVAVGDQVAKDDSLITLESEKASMDVPAPYLGTITKLSINIGDSLTIGDEIGMMTIVNNKQTTTINNPTTSSTATTTRAPINFADIAKSATIEVVEANKTNSSHATPSVRRLARDFGIELTNIRGTGRKRRVVVEDLQDYVKSLINAKNTGFPALPVHDYSKFGEVELIDLSNIKQATAVHVHGSWVNIPQVTHFDEVDITDLEAYRKNYNQEVTDSNDKLTPLAFIMKAIVLALQEFPNFNASLASNKQQLVCKKYYNIGVAVETDNGLVVPVIKDVAVKNIYTLAKELRVISTKARSTGLSLAEMQGNTFTISSLGGIGGVAFTPIVNYPDVAILGVSKAQLKPVFIDGGFVPRLMLPISLSYDHRVIDGAEAAKFTNFINKQLTEFNSLRGKYE